MSYNPLNLATNSQGEPFPCYWENCMLSAGEQPTLPTLSCQPGFEFSCEECKCVTDETINNKPLSAFNYDTPDLWQFAVSWEMKDKERVQDVSFKGLSGAALSAFALANSTVDSYAALAVARFDARRKNFKVDIVPGTIVNASGEDVWGDEKVFEGLRLSTDVFYLQDYFDLLHSTQSAGTINNSIEYVKFWFDGELPEQIVDRQFARRNPHLCPPWADDPGTPFEDIVECQAEVNKWMQYRSKIYRSFVRDRQKSGYGVVASPSTRNNGVSALTDYINQSLVLHGVNSVKRDDSVRALTNSVKLFTREAAEEVKVYRNLPMDSGIIKYNDGIIRRDQFGKFVTNITQDDRTEFIVNGDPFLSSSLDGSIKTLLEPGGSLSSVGPGQVINIDKTWNETCRIPGTVWTEVDALYTPIYTVLSAVSSSYWPVSAPSGSVIKPYVDHLNRLYPEEIPVNEVIEPSFWYLILSSFPALSSHTRINTLSAGSVSPWWNPSLLTHVSFVSGGSVGARKVISLAYNKIDLNNGFDISNTTLLNYNNTLIEVNNAYDGAIMGLVLEDYEVEPFVVDINNPQIVLNNKDKGVTKDIATLRGLGFA